VIFRVAVGRGEALLQDAFHRGGQLAAEHAAFTLTFGRRADKEILGNLNFRWASNRIDQRSPRLMISAKRRKRRATGAAPGGGLRSPVCLRGDPRKPPPAAAASSACLMPVPARPA
jgi:hypothetical protein